MTNKHCEFWEEIVGSEEDKKTALEAATRKGLQWVSTSRIQDPESPGFIPHVYRMRFAKRPGRKVIKFVGYAPTEKKLGRR